MAWNPSPRVAAARDFGKKFDQDIVVIVSVSFRKNNMSVTTYGRTKTMCEGVAKRLGDVAYDAVYEALKEE